MKHAGADLLREYQFDLLADAERAEIAAHLRTCAECQNQLAAIRVQFAALDVLNDQPDVSDERLKAVLAESRKVGTSKVIPFRPALVLAAAASVALAFLLIRPNGSSDEDVASTLTSTPASSLAELRATRPFAPASNIELNVLPRRDEVQITIYNAEDLTLVREKRKMTLKRGWNWLQFMWANTLIDPTSLELKPVTYADQIEITQLVYPPRLNELARWTIFSEHSGEAEFELTYFTSGLKWNAFYEATLSPDEKTMNLTSHVRVDNHSGEEYENTQTRLVVGEINLADPIAALAKRQPAFGRPASPRSGYDVFTYSGIVLPDMSGTVAVLDEREEFELGDRDKQKEIIKQALSEYQLYTIEGRETIPDGWGKRLPNIEASGIGVTNLYKFDAERWGDQTTRFLSFANTEARALGETPLPEGTVRVFGSVVDGASSSVGHDDTRQSTHQTEGRSLRPSLRSNGAGSSVYKLSYINAAQLDYIPIGEDVELELGPAAKVMVEPKLTRIREENHEFDRKGNISGWDAVSNWTIEITNTKAVPVDVEITRATGVKTWTLVTDAPFEKHDVDHFRFTVTVEPRTTRLIEYELTTKHGTREE